MEDNIDQNSEGTKNASSEDCAPGKPERTGDHMIL